MPQLLIQIAGTPENFLLDQELFTIGRAAENTIVLDHESVSSWHAEIELKDGRYFVRDLDSSNGTTLNGVPVSTAELKAGDSVCFGPVEAKVALASVPDEALASVPDEASPPAVEKLGRAVLPPPIPFPTGSKLPDPAAAQAENQPKHGLQPYYVSVAGDKRGPFTVEQVNSMRDKGEVPTSALYWTIDLDGWRPLVELFAKQNSSSITSIPVVRGIDLDNLKRWFHFAQQKVREQCVAVSKVRSNDVKRWVDHANQKVRGWSLVKRIAVLSCFGLCAASLFLVSLPMGGDSLLSITNTTTAKKWPHGIVVISQARDLESGMLLYDIRHDRKQQTMEPADKSATSVPPNYRLIMANGKSFWALDLSDDEVIGHARLLRPEGEDLGVDLEEFYSATFDESKQLPESCRRLFLLVAYGSRNEPALDRDYDWKNSVPPKDSRTITELLDKFLENTAKLAKAFQPQPIDVVRQVQSNLYEVAAIRNVPAIHGNFLLKTSRSSWNSNATAEVACEYTGKKSIKRSDNSSEELPVYEERDGYDAEYLAAHNTYRASLKELLSAIRHQTLRTTDIERITERVSDFIARGNEKGMVSYEVSSIDAYLDRQKKSRLEEGAPRLIYCSEVIDFCVIKWFLITCSGAQ